MTACFLGRDLLFYARIAAAAERAGVASQRLDSPEQLPPAAEVRLLVVDWADRAPDWGERLGAWKADSTTPRIILYGPHTDLEAHADARAAGLAPMWARSRLVAELRSVFDSAAAG